MVRRFFTVDEANEVIERIRPKLRRIRDSLQGRAQVDWEELNQLISELLEEAKTEGFIIRDLVNGVVDFPTITIEGDEAYLCWVVDEDEVAYWHGPEGFIGRRPITDKRMFGHPLKELD